MFRFVSAYRWELALLLAIPVVSGWVNAAALFVDAALGDSAWSETWRGRHAIGAVGFLVSPVALGVCYVRVRKLGREYLALLWRYQLALAIVGVAVGIALPAGVSAAVEPDDLVGYLSYWVASGWSTSR